MARFLFSIWPERGHIYPSLPVAYALRAAGHEVAYSTLPEFRHLLESQGIVYLPREQQVPATGDTTPRETAELQAIKDAYRRKFVASVPAQVSALQEAAAAWQPDVLVNDPVSYAPLIVGELEERPLATFNVTTFSWPGTNVAPFGLGLPRARDEATRTRYAILRARGEAFFADVVAAWNAVRAGYGLPPRPGPLPVATLSPYLQMLPTIPAFDYERDDLPPQVHYVGPCIWSTREPLDDETEAWLAGLPAEMPVVLVTASTQISRTTHLVEAAVAGLAESGLAVLAALPFEHPLHQAPLPPSVRLARFLSYDAVLPRCALMVTHSGFGTVTKALSQSLPLVVVPYASDQLEVAQRVVEAGAGLRLHPAALSASALREAVAAVLHEDRYRTGARALCAALAHRDGPAEATALLSRLAETRRPVLRDGRAVETMELLQ